MSTGSGHRTLMPRSSTSGRYYQRTRAFWIRPVGRAFLSRIHDGRIERAWNRSNAPRSEVYSGDVQRYALMQSHAGVMAKKRLSFSYDPEEDDVKKRLETLSKSSKFPEYYKRSLSELTLMMLTIGLDQVDPEKGGKVTNDE